MPSNRKLRPTYPPARDIIIRRREREENKEGRRKIYLSSIGTQGVMASECEPIELSLSIPECRATGKCESEQKSWEVLRLWAKAKQFAQNLTKRKRARTRLQLVSPQI
jgi:hypothetical protein